MPSLVNIKTGASDIVAIGEACGVASCAINAGFVVARTSEQSERRIHVLRRLKGCIAQHSWLDFRERCRMAGNADDGNGAGFPAARWMGAVPPSYRPPPQMGRACRA